MRTHKIPSSSSASGYKDIYNLKLILLHVPTCTRVHSITYMLRGYADTIIATKISWLLYFLVKVHIKRTSPLKQWILVEYVLNSSVYLLTIWEAPFMGSNRNLVIFQKGNCLIGLKVYQIPNWAVSVLVNLGETITKEHFFLSKQINKYAGPSALLYFLPLSWWNYDQRCSLHKAPPTETKWITLPDTEHYIEFHSPYHSCWLHQPHNLGCQHSCLVDQEANYGMFHCYWEVHLDGKKIYIWFFSYIFKLILIPV